MWLRQHECIYIYACVYIFARSATTSFKSGEMRHHACILYEIMRRALNFDGKIKIMANENYEYNFIFINSMFVVAIMYFLAIYCCCKKLFLLTFCWFVKLHNFKAKSRPNSKGQNKDINKNLLFFSRSQSIRKDLSIDGVLHFPVFPLFFSFLLCPPSCGILR